MLKPSQKRLARVFRAYGDLVGQKPLCFLLLPALCTLCMLPGFMYARFESDISKLFTSKDARWNTEKKNAEFFESLQLNTPSSEKWSIQGKNCNVSGKNNTIRPPPEKSPNGCPPDKLYSVYAVNLDGSNLLTRKTMGILNVAAVEFRRNFSYEFKGANYHYLEDFCAIPGQVCRNMNGWISQVQILLSNKKDPNIKLTYPVMNFYERSFDVGHLIYGVETEAPTGHIKSAKVLVLHFDFQCNLNNLKAANIFPMKFRDYWLDKSGKIGFEFIPFAIEYFNNDNVEIAKSTAPAVLITVLILITFMVFSNLSANPVNSKPFEGFMGVISVIMALMSSFGLLFYLGIELNSVAAISIYLVLIIGVDDVFLILAAWKETDSKLPPRERMAIMMGEVGASIAITSLTDGLCFGIGAIFCPAPAVSNFCLFAAVAVIFDFGYQISFFAAIVSYGGHREKEGKVGFPYAQCTKKILLGISEVRSMTEAPATWLSKISSWKNLSESAGSGGLASKLLAQYYAPMICKTEVRWLTLLLYTLYTCTCFYGCCTIDVHLNRKNGLHDHSHLHRVMEIFEQYKWSDNLEPTVLILQPQDFRKPANLRRLLDFAWELEHTEYSSGTQSSKLWLRDYIKFISDFVEASLAGEFYNKTYLSAFFRQKHALQHRESVKFQCSDDSSSNQAFLSAFKFNTLFVRLKTWRDRQQLVRMWRKICDKYRDIEPTVLHRINGEVDWLNIIPATSIQTIGLAVIAMTTVSAAFIPHKLSMFYVTWSLLSITMGIIGGLSLWDCDLDPMSSTCILISIGFAVDFSAHICYRYQNAPPGKPMDKLVETIKHVGWPIIQAAVSSFLGVFTIAFVPANMARIFFKSNLLVFSSGLVHAMIFLPTLQITMDLSATPRVRSQATPRYRRTLHRVYQ